ncbi:MAG: gliding motility-associated C-terminal domain-containing protein [Bacteroidetes bacterium]|nr:gliding motility-associated C-terminal domain-containing protein [Bacteroidota bacterium]
MHLEIILTGNISLLQDSCNLTVNYQSQVNNAIDIIWDFGDGNTSATSSGIHNYNLAGNYVVILTATNACTVTQLTQNIVVDPAFEPEIFTALTLDTCLLQLTFNHSSTNTYDQIWDFGDGNSSLDQSGLHQYSIPGTYELTFSVNNLSGCKRDTTLNLQIPEGGGDFFIPNIFTPNNDGVNDVFEVGAAGACSPERITIFNRWGNSIFETSGQNKFWDGKSNGNPVPSGVYFYVIQIGEKVYKGTVTVTY